MWFPIASGTHALGRELDEGPIQCESCHDRAADSFRVLACTSCHSHAQTLTDKLHGSTPPIADYAYTSASCFRCHADGAKVVPFLHSGIPTDEASECAFCHQPDATYAALPVAGLDHQAITALPSAGGPDCGRCHVTTTWDGASRVPAGAFDPARNVPLTALIPTYSGAEISALTPRSESLPMPMNHDSAQIPQATLDSCVSCHVGAASGAYRPGDLHASLRTLGLAQPTSCLECHAASMSMPVGFVGPMDAARNPLSGAMKHDAVLWVDGAPGATAIVPAECSSCHAAPARDGDGWAFNRMGSTPALFHATLQGPQPSSCVDCHANSRPQDILDQSNATLPAGANWAFDHTSEVTKADCAGCHEASARTAYSAWSGGRFHLAAAATPTTCVPCHEGDRPTSTASWMDPNYQRSPFDYVTNPRAIPHGASLDCATCHLGPGTGAWGGTQNWQRGAFDHDPTASIAATTCRDCHMSQRPDLQPGTTAAAMAQLLGGFDHSVAGTGECKGCHQPTVTASRYVDYVDPATGRLPGGDWQGATNTPNDAFDPARSLTLTALIPTYAGTSIVSVTPQVEVLPMNMDHSSVQVPAAVLADCTNCHAGAPSGEYYPGDLHSSLGTLGLPQPGTCVGCHSETSPVGFVGPPATNPVRSPSSPEMKHDAVRWSGGVPTAAALVTQDCATCHRAPSATAATWDNDRMGGTPANYHGALAAQPASCVDCHANSRPSGVLTMANATLPSGVAFDHQTPEAVADCAGCHGPGSAPAFSAWSSGRYHLTGSTTPSTCLPCHEGQRPSSTAGWVSTTYTRAPFDYGTNSRGRPHGNAEDCATCHTGPGTGGTWGVSQSWVGGNYRHGPGTTAAQTCVACHTTQRPDLLPGTTPAAVAALLGFDHAASGTGDCFGCHQATVMAGRYTDYFNATTGMLPNGDWTGGQSYPGSTLVTAPTQVISVTQTNLVRSAPNNLVRGVTTIAATYHNAMLHTSASVPAAIASGPDANPNFAGCWHCHQNDNGVVTSYAEGQFHAALTMFRATPGGAVTPLPQPTAGCNDCHAQMRPVGIVERAGSVLRPMDHAAPFTAAVVINGRSIAGAGAMDCSSCHAGVTRWDDGAFHPNIAAAVPLDCTGCHYPLMADTARSDHADARRYAMRHASNQLTFQACNTCHVSALTPAATANVSAPAWSPGGLHTRVGAQPTACVDCHAGSTPLMTTASSFTYTLPLGGTASNGAQWMNHASARVVGRDCAVCHTGDARANGSAWSRSSSFHVAVPNPSTCQECHGLTNGGGTVVGTNNNLPTGLTNSDMPSTAAMTPSTGVPAGTRAQITHTDINVRSRDCGTCHTQVGRSTVGGIQGREWAQASFHPRFTGANVLVMNGSTGRCSNCHMNDRPGAAYMAQDHSAFTATSMVDCSSCHSIPGTGTLIAPNWLGAAGLPAFISVGGFTITQPPAMSPTIQPGINNLPHPTVAAGVMCTDCHASASGGRRARGYDHASTLIDNNCRSCHEAGSDLIATPWNGATAEANGAGDTRPYTLNSVTARFSGNTRNVTWPNHFYPVDCKECHLKPAGFGYTTTGSAYRTNTGAWGNNSTSTNRNFPHNERVMTRPSTCLMCHNPIPD